MRRESNAKSVASILCKVKRMTLYVKSGAKIIRNPPAAKLKSVCQIKCIDNVFLRQNCLGAILKQTPDADKAAPGVSLNWMVCIFMRWSVQWQQGYDRPVGIAE